MIRHKILDVEVKRDSAASQMETDLNILKRNNKIFKFKPY